jgi:hypothetical protein
MDMECVRARATLVGDYGRKLEGDYFYVPVNIARDLARRRLVDLCHPAAAKPILDAPFVVVTPRRQKQQQPLVSCIMPTKDRAQFVPGAIDGFLRQTYPHKELIVLDDGESIEELLPENPAIRYVRVEGNLCIGAKRNMCCEQAKGELIAHWDDDDWSMPTRLEEQVKTLQEHPEASITGYNSLLFLDQRSGKAWRYTGKAKYLVGTSLMYRREFWEKRRFSDVQIGEDGKFIAGAPVFALPGEKKMVARIHKQTTAPKLGGEEWRMVPLSELPEMN